MQLIKLILQVVIALGIFNVWFLRFNQRSAWRGASAANLKAEFAAYGLPTAALYLVGFLKVLCALLLLAAIWIPAAAQPAASLIALLMLGAIAMHVKIGDPIKKSLPAATLLVLSLLVVIL
jgi:hypothetical protein